MPTINGIQISLLSPERIRELSSGEVTNDVFVYYRAKREPSTGMVDNNSSSEGFIYGGLFCERIFGPVKDYTCGCHKYKNSKAHAGIVCSHCGVPVVKSSVRSERLGHIELAAPVCHPWFLKGGGTSKIALLLGLNVNDICDVAKCDKYIVLDPKNTELTKWQILDASTYESMREMYDSTEDIYGTPTEGFISGTGGAAIRQALMDIDLEATYNELKERIECTKSEQVKKNLYKRIALVRDFIESGNKPEWMVLTVLPVMPPNLRPLSKLDSGMYATSDINELYRKVIEANNNLKQYGAVLPGIVYNEMVKELQIAVMRLYNNHRMKPTMNKRGNGTQPAMDKHHRVYKALSAGICGKHGRFRQNLLGKRVDYSGRSVIVVGPNLKMYQCGLPKEMALELFTPFVIHDYIERVKAEDGEEIKNRTAKRIIESRSDDRIWDSLENVIKGKCVLLNRAPTLHRLGIQAFEPVLVEGHAIKLHPLVCTGFNADFDGDQMAVHVPLSEKAQNEAHELMLATKNLLKPADGKPVAVPSQDMVLGVYYITMPYTEETAQRCFATLDEAKLAYANNVITLHTHIKVRMDGRMYDSTLGRCIFNEIIPQDLGFVDRSTLGEREGKLEIDFHVKKKELGRIINKCIEVYGVERTTKLLDDLKDIGYKYSTKSGISLSAFDVIIPKEKREIIENTSQQVNRYKQFYNRGFMSNEERISKTITAWNKATDDVTEVLENKMPATNSLFMMADSGARGSTAQIRQLAGMRGLIANASGGVIEVPITRNYMEGLTILDYFVSSRGARKGMADTALRTAKSGYLTRKLVDVSQDVVVSMDDCGATEGLVVSSIMAGGTKELESLSERLMGRYLVRDETLPDGTVISKDTLITKELAEQMEKSGRQSFEIRSVMHCCSPEGVCAKCYGMDLAKGEVVEKGVAVGVIAAQSIGEPGTQLTMRTFHTGGVANTEDITQGMPRVEEIFENRGLDRMAILSPLTGTVSISKESGKKKSIITITDANGLTETCTVKGSALLLVSDGDKVERGQRLTQGMVHSSEILRVSGKVAAENYIIGEIQQTYRTQGVDINDKHIEIIIRQMFNKVRITDAGSSNFIEGKLVTRAKVDVKNKELRERIANGEDLALVKYEDIIQGIQVAAKNSDSFISAASFQETERALVNAALAGAVDPLHGLKENVVIGSLLPVGEGFYRKQELREKSAIELEGINRFSTDNDDELDSD